MATKSSETKAAAAKATEAVKAAPAAEVKKEVPAVKKEEITAVAAVKKPAAARTGAEKKPSAAKTAAEKKPSSAKTGAEKKSSPAKTGAEKKPAASAKKKAEPQAAVVIEYSDKKIFAREVLDSAKKAYAAMRPGVEIKNIEIYVKPEESVAYYVVNGEGSDDFKVIL